MEAGAGRQSVGRGASNGALARGVGIEAELHFHFAAMDLDIAVWRQRDRYYAIPPLEDPVISIHVGGAGRVRYGEGDGWSRRSSTVGTVTFLPPGVPTRWLVENGAVEHLSITIGCKAPLRAVVTSAVDCIEVGVPDALNVQLAQTLIEILTGDSALDRAGELLVSSLCETLLRNFARLHRIAYRASMPAPHSTCAVSSRAIQAIEARFAEPLKVGDLAADAGLSAAHFTEVFKKATGITPHQYLMRVRVERVCQALKDNDTPLAEIACNFGFSSQSHLNAAFRKLSGLTPNQYRQRQRV